MLRVMVGIVVLILLVLVNTVVVMWVERKFVGHIGWRLGPTRTGPFGLVQPIADAFKMLGKEDITPSGVETWVFKIAPLINFTPALLIYVAMPWVESFADMSFDVGIFMLFAVAALAPVGILVAGWSSHNKYSLLGGFRAAAQQISYEVPTVLAVLGVVILAGSMKLSDIVEAQATLWNVVTQPLAFVLFFIGTLAELNRTPFDLPESESELVGGFNTEYSSMRFALFFVGEYANVFTWSLIGALLFLGGWNGPLLPGVVWLLLKTYALVLLIIWVRGTFPRVRVDQLMDVGWKLLLPAALVNLMITAVGAITSPAVLIALEVLGTLGFVWIMTLAGERVGERSRQEAAERIASSEHLFRSTTMRSVPSATAVTPLLDTTSSTSEGTVTL